MRWEQLDPQAVERVEPHGGDQTKCTRNEQVGEGAGHQVDGESAKAREHHTQNYVERKGNEIEIQNVSYGRDLSKAEGFTALFEKGRSIQAKHEKDGKNGQAL